MRPVLHGDVISVARAMLRVEAGERERLCIRIFRQAEQADIYVLRHRKLHPKFGNGSLMAAARRLPLADEPTFDNTEYCQCVISVLTLLATQNDLGS